MGDDFDCMGGSNRRCLHQPLSILTGVAAPDIGRCASQGCDPALERLLGLCEAIAAPAVRWLDDPADIDEAIQRTRIQVHQKVAQKRAEGSLRAWIRQIGVNEARMINRKRFEATRPIQGLPAEDALDGNQSPGISTAVADRDLWRWTVTQLSENHAETYLMREVSKLTYEEIASQLDIPLSTAKTRVRRARMHLAELMMSHDPDRRNKR